MSHETGQPTTTASTPPPEPSFFAPVKDSFAMIIALSAVSAVASVVPYIAVVELAKALIPSLDGGVVDTGRVWWIVAIAAVALLVSVGAAFGSGMFSHFVDARLQLSIRRRIVAHLQRLPLGWFDARNSGTVRKLIENDVSAIHQLVAHAVHDVTTAVVVPLVSIVYLFVVDWRVALAALLPMVIAVVMISLYMRDAKDDKYGQYEAAVERLSGATAEFVQGIAVVKRFGQVGRSHRRYRDETGRYVRFTGDWTDETAKQFTAIEVLTSPVVVMTWLLTFGYWLVSTGRGEPIDVLPGLLLGLGLTTPLLRMGASGQFLRNAAKAQASLSAFLASPAIPESAHPVRPDGHRVGFDDVDFGYDGDHRVLHEITADCRPGTVTALVGASGSGKSTMAKLVPRFYDTTSGAVTIGDADVRDIASHELYREAGFVFQDVQLLRASLRDNIALCRPDATDREIEDAARAAQIHDRIGEFTRGYDSVIGDDAQLSGGEAQRVTIARALLADAKVLVLDEATAFADPDSEAAIQRALTRLAAGRTVLVIAHRLHTIVGADQICVLDGGRIVERGTHAELVAAGGVFAQMWAAYQANHERSVPEGARR
ncbi:MAG: ABC transporter ATP-binding protein [Gordonia sp. (in: high G+C Gram-positive bacteria)]|uniref:ABC transporter ATP-binding protein n=1 Tax=Gordonia sp. (in: high G+C Gram-positive bacteria) TaxID=84139 RepID=UPI0039E5A9AD